MSFYERMLEADYNPFILFSQTGKVLSLNKSAQFLLGSASAETIFNHAVNHATTSYGFKTTYLDITFGRFVFFAINVGYENEDEIAIMLYRSPSMEPKIDSKLQSQNEPVNVYSLMDLCISSTSIGKEREFVRDFDPTLPEIRINTNQFIKMFSLMLNSTPDKSNIHMKLALNIGEYIKIDTKKYSIFSIAVTLDAKFEKDNFYSIEKFAAKLGAQIHMESQKITIDMAIIT